MYDSTTSAMASFKANTGMREASANISDLLGNSPASSSDLTARLVTSSSVPASAASSHRRDQFSRATISGESWRLLLSGPGRGYNFLKGTLATDLANAHTVRIVCAYFLPTWRIRRELERAARRGGRVQLVLAGKSDVRLSQLASQRLYSALLKRGVEIYEYQPQVLHAKLFIVDEQVYVGSSNLDARSLNINYELLVRIGDGRVVEEARSIFEEILSRSRRVELKTWRGSRSVWTKLREEWAYFLLGRVDPWWARGRAKYLQ